MRARLEAAGGVVFENTALSGVTVAPDGVSLEVAGPPSASANGNGGGGGSTRRLVARLVLDCMGHQSPIVRQIRCVRKHRKRGGCWPCSCQAVVGVWDLMASACLAVAACTLLPAHVHKALPISRVPIAPCFLSLHTWLIPGLCTMHTGGV